MNVNEIIIKILARGPKLEGDDRCDSIHPMPILIRLKLGEHITLAELHTKYGHDGNEMNADYDTFLNGILIKTNKDSTLYKEVKSYYDGYIKELQKELKHIFDDKIYGANIRAKEHNERNKAIQEGTILNRKQRRLLIKKANRR